MSRWENENVAGLDLPEPQVNNTVYIDITGKQSEDLERSVGKIQYVNEKATYFVKFGRGEIFDPHGIDKNKISTFQFRKVSKGVYENYLEYLKSRREVFLVRAARQVKEGK